MRVHISWHAHATTKRVYVWYIDSEFSVQVVAALDSALGQSGFGDVSCLSACWGSISLYLGGRHCSWRFQDRPGVFGGAPVNCVIVVVCCMWCLCFKLKSVVVRVYRTTQVRTNRKGKWR